MKAVFADSVYFLAAVNPRDQYHLRVIEMSQAEVFSVVTTVWILTEVADALSGSDNRAAFVALMNDLQADPDTTIIPATQKDWDRGVAYFENRADKDWSLTDCISFIVMQDRGLSDALTADRHFKQAGFNALMS